MRVCQSFPSHLDKGLSRAIKRHWDLGKVLLKALDRDIDILGRDLRP